MIYPSRRYPFAAIEIVFIFPTTGPYMRLYLPRRWGPHWKGLLQRSRCWHIPKNSRLITMAVFYLLARGRDFT